MSKRDHERFRDRDLAKAFDTVNHVILLNKLERYGIIGVANNLIKDYLDNRVQTVNVDNLYNEILGIESGIRIKIKIETGNKIKKRKGLEMKISTYTYTYFQLSVARDQVFLLGYSFRSRLANDVRRRSETRIKLSKEYHKYFSSAHSLAAAARGAGRTPRAYLNSPKVTSRISMDELSPEARVGGEFRFEMLIPMNKFACTVSPAPSMS
ncbi:hypothetical protein EVAR_33725_1 [Eumeta japonica]|uniref:Reverse transcriptase domain-containing protein n=1 Tax=Eumeta variegata TaxID=151549 RepID=A0A4C1VV31_EUMVA|nr:hypothetical protein EVAR_33725_1 [Eumeta japonica]